MREFLRQVGSFLPHLFVMLVIIAIGFGMAWAMLHLVQRLLGFMSFDQLSSRLGLSRALVKGGVKNPPSAIISQFLYWVILLAFILLGLGALNLTAVDQFVAQALWYIPKVFISFVILVVGFILGNFFGQAILIAAVNAQIREAGLLGKGVRLGIILFSVAMAFEQLGIATQIIVAAFSIAFGGIVLALSLACGLGGKDLAKEIIEKKVKKEGEPKEEEVSHF
jgi:hypothetical protein